MGRKKFCQNIGKKHIYTYRYPSAGYQVGDKTIFYCEKLCKICKYKKHDKATSGVYIWGHEGYTKISDNYKL